MAASKVAPDIKAAALADLMAGEQPAVVAERYGIDRETVKSWKRRYVAPGDAPIAPTSAPVQKPAIERQQQAIGAIILDLLRAKLEASRAIAQAANDPAWIKLQPAAELAVFGQWLDASAFAIGDRLASASQPARDASADGE